MAESESEVKKPAAVKAMAETEAADEEEAVQARAMLAAQEQAKEEVGGKGLPSRRGRRVSEILPRKLGVGGARTRGRGRGKNVQRKGTLSTLKKRERSAPPERYHSPPQRVSIGRIFFFLSSRLVWRTGPKPEDKVGPPLHPAAWL